MKEQRQKVDGYSVERTIMITYVYWQDKYSVRNYLYRNSL